MDSITIIATGFSLLLIGFAVASLFFLYMDSVNITLDDHLKITLHDGKEFDVKSNLNDLGEAEKLIDALYDSSKGKR
jgi:hypothetical protein